MSVGANYTTQQLNTFVLHLKKRLKDAKNTCQMLFQTTKGKQALEDESKRFEGDIEVTKDFMMCLLICRVIKNTNESHYSLQNIDFLHRRCVDYLSEF